MNADEIVMALRICNRSKGHRCSECPVFSRYEHRICKATVDRAAADLIESLTAQLERFNATLAREGFTELETMIAKYKTVMLAANELSIEADEEIEALREQLKESQRMADAAVEDLNSYAATCLICSNVDKCDHDQEDGCFVWRGPQQAGEGERDE